MAITLLIGSPPATAKVRASWNEIPQSAWPEPISVSGALLPYGSTWSSTPASAYQPLACATKKPVWSVFGVQSSASRTGWGVGVAVGAAGAGVVAAAVGAVADPAGAGLGDPLAAQPAPTI